MHDEKSRVKEFKINDTMLVRSYKRDGEMWMTGTVVNIKIVLCTSWFIYTMNIVLDITIDQITQRFK